MNVNSNLTARAIQGPNQQSLPTTAPKRAIEDLVKDVFDYNPDFLKRLDRIETEIESFQKNGARVQTPEGPMKLRGASSLLKTSDGFVLKLLKESGIPVQDWAIGHPKKDGLLAKFDGESQTISVKEIRVRPHLRGFGKEKSVEDIGAVTTYKLNLANHSVNDLNVEEFKGSGSESQWADFRVSQ